MHNRNPLVKGQIMGGYTRQPPSSREDLGDQHVRRLDTNAEDSRTIACEPFSAAGVTASLRRRSCSIALRCRRQPIRSV